MANLLDKDPLSFQISKLFKDLEDELNQELLNFSRIDFKWAISKLDPSFSHELPRNKIKEFQIKHGIKIKQGNIIVWNPNYQLEALSDTYELILGLVHSYVLGLKKETLRNIKKSKSTNTLEINEFINVKINHFYNLIDSDEGTAYCYEDERQSIHRMCKSKLDVVWYINEVYKIFPLEKRKGRSLNYSTDLEYPFIDIDKHQWLDFESALRLIPLFEKCNKIIDKKKLSKNQNSLTPLEQIILIEQLRTQQTDFSSLNIDLKINYLNLITGSNNHNIDEQLKYLENIINMTQDDYEKLQSVATEYGRYMTKIQDKSVDNFRLALSKFNSQVIQEGVNKILTEEEKQKNEVAIKQINKNKVADSKIEKLLKSVE